MITLQSLGAAFQRAHALRRAEKALGERLLAEKMEQRQATEALQLAEIQRWHDEASQREEDRIEREKQREIEWRAELKRREEDRLDADGSRAAARAAREEQIKQERLDFLASQFAIID